MNWYYADNGRQIGPFDEMAFQNLVATRQISPATLVWNSGMTDWKPASEAGVGVAIAEGPLAPCSECGAPHPTGEMIQFGSAWVCANCKDRYTQKLREGVNVAAKYTYAGFWIRVGASFIDAIIVWAFFLITNGFAFGWDQFLIQRESTALKAPVALLQYVVAIGYHVWLVSKFGGQVGKLALGLRVITRDGNNLSMLHATGRYFAQLLSALTIFIGYAMAGWDEEKRTLHDRICNTRVIRR
jgi:uncharacterized RDD family membrane protein YckC